MNPNANARKALRHARRYKGGASHIYQRLLRGEISPERYLTVMKRGVDMRLRADRPQTFRGYWHETCVPYYREVRKFWLGR